MVVSGRVFEKRRIGASTEKHYQRVPEKFKISVSTKKLLNLGEYREMVEFVRVPKNCPDEYLKGVESGRVLGKRRIGASTEKHYRRVPEKVKISVSTKIL